MLLQQPIYLFFIFLCFVVVIHFFGKNFSTAVLQKLFFVATLVTLTILYRSIFSKFFILIAFYLLLIYIAVRLKNIPRYIFVILAVLPLLLLKLSDVIPSLIVFKKKIAIVGISYVTFRVIQVLLDLDGYQPKKYINLFLFMFNPLTLLAGPLDRFQRFEENLEAIKESLNNNFLFTGWYFLLLGIFQKFVLAYFWSALVMSKFSEVSLDWLDIVGTAYTYVVYLFLDFSGYSLMAMGSGYMIGILFPANFDSPWLTKNPKDLWKRFHITLGSFLNDYFFKPIYMFLIRKQFFKPHRLTAQNIALMLTFLLMGAWNGLKWYYILSGTMFGVAAVFYNTYQARYAAARGLIVSKGMITIYRFFFLNYIVWALYLFSGKLPS